jgi:hypothetical protein
LRSLGLFGNGAGKANIMNHPEPIRSEDDPDRVDDSSESPVKVDSDDGDEPDDGEGFAPGPTGQLGVPPVER